MPTSSSDWGCIVKRRNVVRLSKVSRPLKGKLRYSCPTCHVLPGKKCVSLTQKLYQKELKAFHAARGQGTDEAVQEAEEA